MNLIEQLEALRYSDDVLLSKDDPVDYWELIGGNSMLDNCLEIVWKWLMKEGYIK